MMHLQEKVAPVLRELANRLIEATPEWWTEATLRVDVTRRPNGDSGLSHSISSEQHPRDRVEATEGIFESTRALQLLCDKARQPWTRLIFSIEQGEKGWTFSTDFEHSDRP